jgi:hypothetical protein
MSQLGGATRGRRCGGTIGEEDALGGQGHGSEGAEWCGVARWLSREEEKRRLPRTNNATVTHGVTVACAVSGGDVAPSDQQRAGLTNSTGASGSGGSDRSWRGRNSDSIDTIAMGRAQFTAELIF